MVHDTHVYVYAMRVSHDKKHTDPPQRQATQRTLTHMNMISSINSWFRIACIVRWSWLNWNSFTIQGYICGDKIDHSVFIHNDNRLNVIRVCECMQYMSMIWKVSTSISLIDVNHI